MFIPHTDQDREEMLAAIGMQRLGPGCNFADDLLQLGFLRIREVQARCCAVDHRLLVEFIEAVEMPAVFASGQAGYEQHGKQGADKNKAFFHEDLL